MNMPILINKLLTHVFVAIETTLRRQNELLFYCWYVRGYMNTSVSGRLPNVKAKCVQEVGNCSNVFAVAVVRARETVKISSISFTGESGPRD